MQGKQIIVSGVITTGKLHLGNYLGAIKNWVNLQNDYSSIFFLADLHAITTEQDPKELHNNILDIAITYIACGIDPTSSIIYPQSSVYTHSELAWILNCFTRLGWLNRMTQFKDKSGKDKEKAFVGLYTYPILQAADILQFKANLVPVGEDQKQHIELTRDIASSFNRNYQTETFVIPEPYIVGEATRVMSLRDASSKMSKSDPSDYSRINLFDDADTIKLKIQKSKSDSEVISFDNIESRLELKNLANIYAALNDSTMEKVINDFAGKGFSDLKKSLVDLAVSKLEPISNNIKRLSADKPHVVSILRKGSEKALGMSEPFLKEIKEVIGYYNF